MNPLNYMRLHDYPSRNSRQHWINASNGKIRSIARQERLRRFGGQDNVELAVWRHLFPPPATADQRRTEASSCKHPTEFGQRIGLTADPKGVDDPCLRITDKVSPGVGLLAWIVKIFRQHQLREASSDEIVSYPPFLRTVQGGEEPRGIHVQQKHATRTQTATEALQHLCGIMAGHLGEAPEDER